MCLFGGWGGGWNCLLFVCFCYSLRSDLLSLSGLFTKSFCHCIFFSNFKTLRHIQDCIVENYCYHTSDATMALILFDFGSTVFSFFQQIFYLLLFSPKKLVAMCHVIVLNALW